MKVTASGRVPGQEAYSVQKLFTQNELKESGKYHNEKKGADKETLVYC